MASPAWFRNEDYLGWHSRGGWWVLFGLFGGMVLIENVSSNTHDRSLEAAMTGAFVIGPAMAVLAVIVILVYRISRSR